MADEFGGVPVTKTDDFGGVPLGATGTQQPPKTGFWKRLGENLNPLPLAKGLVTDFPGTVKSLVTPADEPAAEAVDAAKKGQYGLAAERTVEDMPIFGPPIRRFRQALSNQDYGAAAADVAAAALPGALSKLKAKIPIPSSLNPVEQSAANWAEAHNVPVDVGTGTGNKFAGAMQQTVEKQPFLANRIDTLKRAQQTALQREGSAIAQGVAPTAPAEPVAAGEAVADTLKRRVGKLNTVADQSYDKLRQLANDPKNQKLIQVGEEDSGLVDANGNAITRPVMKTVKMPTDYTAVKAQIKPLVDQIEQSIPQAQRDASPGYRAMKQILAQPDVVGVDAAIRDLSSIQNMARTAGELPEVRGMSKGLAANLVPKLRSAIDDAAAAAGPDAEAALNRGRLATRSKYAVNDVYESLPRNATGEVEPGQVFKRLTRNDDQSLQMLRSVQGKAPGAIPGVARAYVEGLVDDMVYQGDVRRAQSAVRAWHNLGQETKDILFDKATQQNITDFTNYAEMLGRRANPSGTAPTWAAVAAAMHPKVLAAELVAGKPVADALFGNAGAIPKFPVGLGPIPKMIGGAVGYNLMQPSPSTIGGALGGSPNQ